MKTGRVWRTTARAVLMCAAVALCVLLLSCPAARAATRNAAVVAHLGDTVPITMYMRLKRQVSSPFFFGGGADETAAQLKVDEGDVVEDNEGNVVEERGTAGATAVPDELNMTDLQLPSLGAATGKHQNQLVRTLPPAFAPRFGINRAVTIVANGTLRAAGQTLEDNKDLQQSALAVRFSVGHGLHKESTWLPLAARHKFTNILAQILGNRLAALQKVEGDNRGEVEDALAAAEKDNEHPAVDYLTRVTFYFGYQTGELQKLTSFSIKAQYSAVQKPGIELYYIWDEHRPYNPNRALVLCSAASLLVAMMMMLSVFHPSSRSMLLFSQRIVAVRAHD